MISIDADGEPASGARPVNKKAQHIRRAATTFFEDSFGEHFPPVLNRMTQAAVKILEDAMASKDRGVIRLIANTWVEALNNPILYPGFGETMMERIV